MADVLPSPTGGANPWGLATQVVPKQPMNPLLTALMSREGQRQQAEGNLRNTIAGQLGNIGQFGGGRSMIESLNQLMQHASPGFNASQSFAVQADPARIRDMNATANLKQMQASEAGSKAGLGFDFRQDGSMIGAGVMNPNQAALIQLIGASKAPRTTNVYQGNVSEGSGTTVKDVVPVYDANGQVSHYASRERKTEREVKGQGKGDLGTANNAGAAMPDMQGMSSQLGAQGEQRIRQELGLTSGVLFVAGNQVMYFDGTQTVPVWESGKGYLVQPQQAQ